MTPIPTPDERARTLVPFSRSAARPPPPPPMRTDQENPPASRKLEEELKTAKTTIAELKSKLLKMEQRNEELEDELKFEQGKRNEEAERKDREFNETVKERDAAVRDLEKYKEKFDQEKGRLEALMNLERENHNADRNAYECHVTALRDRCDNLRVMVAGVSWEEVKIKHSTEVERLMKRVKDQVENEAKKHGRDPIPIEVTEEIVLESMYKVLDCRARDQKYTFLESLIQTKWQEFAEGCQRSYKTMGQMIENMVNTEDEDMKFRKVLFKDERQIKAIERAIFPDPEEAPINQDEPGEKEPRANQPEDEPDETPRDKKRRRTERAAEVDDRNEEMMEQDEVTELDDQSETSETLRNRIVLEESELTRMMDLLKECQGKTFSESIFAGDLKFPDKEAWEKAMPFILKNKMVLTQNDPKANAVIVFMEFLAQMACSFIKTDTVNSVQVPHSGTPAAFDRGIALWEMQSKYHRNKKQSVIRNQINTLIRTVTMSFHGFAEPNVLSLLGKQGTNDLFGMRISSHADYKYDDKRALPTLLRRLTEGKMPWFITPARFMQTLPGDLARVVCLENDFSLDEVTCAELLSTGDLTINEGLRDYFAYKGSAIEREVEKRREAGSKKPERELTNLTRSPITKPTAKKPDDGDKGKKKKDKKS